MIFAIEPELGEGLALTGVPRFGGAALIEPSGVQPGVPSRHQLPEPVWPANAVRLLGVASR